MAQSGPITFPVILDLIPMIEQLLWLHFSGKGLPTDLVNAFVSQVIEQIRERESYG